MKSWGLMLWGNVISIDQTHVHGNTLDEEVHHVPVEAGTTLELARKYDLPFSDHAPMMENQVHRFLCKKAWAARIDSLPDYQSNNCVPRHGLGTTGTCLGDLFCTSISPRGSRLATRYKYVSNPSRNRAHVYETQSTEFFKEIVVINPEDKHLHCFGLEDIATDMDTALPFLNDLIRLAAPISSQSTLGVNSLGFVRLNLLEPVLMVICRNFSIEASPIDGLVAYGCNAELAGRYNLREDQIQYTTYINNQFRHPFPGY